MDRLGVTSHSRPRVCVTERRSAQRLRAGDGFATAERDLQQLIRPHVLHAITRTMIVPAPTAAAGERRLASSRSSA